MKLASYTIAITTFIVRVLAQTADFDRIITPANLQSVPAGESFKISWETPAKYSDEKISISLIGGPTQGTQQPIKTIASRFKSKSYNMMRAVVLTSSSRY